MAAITMCLDERCPLREKCYRFKANPDKYYQSYFFNHKYPLEGCEYFWDMSQHKELQY